MRSALTVDLWYVVIHNLNCCSDPPFTFSDTIQLDHAFTDLRILNNTVINQLTQEGLTSPQPLNKRGSPVENSLYVDCLASQGNHKPVWTTFNPIVGGVTGTIAVGDGYRVEMLSDYMARLSFEYFDPAFTGIYKCLSGRSNAFAEIFITTGILSNIFMHVHISDNVRQKVYTLRAVFDD